MKENKLKVIWLSANRLGYELLKVAKKISGIEIVAVFTLAEGSKTRMYDGVGVGRWHEFGFPVHEVERINDQKDLLKSLSPDLVIMCGWRQIVDSEILEIPKKGFIGFHPTLLPKGRGPAPTINTILEGFKESGVTMFYVSKELDAGDIIGQAKFAVGENDDAGDIYEKTIKGGVELIGKYLPILAQNKAPRIPQRDEDATYFAPRTLKDNEFFLTDSLDEIHRKIRAFARPYLGAYVKTGSRKLIIWKSEIHEIK